MNLFLSISQELKHDSDEAFMRDEALSREIAPMAARAEGLKERDILDALCIS